MTVLIWSRLLPLSILVDNPAPLLLPGLALPVAGELQPGQQVGGPRAAAAQPRRPAGPGAG